MTRRRMSTTRRAAIFARHGGTCHICGLKIAVGEAWEAEHIVPLALSDDDSDDNLAPAHAACHARKTPGDVGRIAKAKRVHAKHIGAHRPKSTLPGSRASKWKRRIGGTTVRRDENAD
jgi:5-methylcytosine-specific restriction enzyme A